MINVNLKCVSNSSKSLDFILGDTYEAQNRGDGLYNVTTSKGWCLICPLEGYFVKFTEVSE